MTDSSQPNGHDVALGNFRMFTCVRPWSRHRRWRRPGTGWAHRSL